MAKYEYVSPAAVYENEKDVITEVSTEGSEIVSFFAGKSVFVTGATGFLGKILVEKLLRSCSGVDTIFILCRDKKGKDLHTRVDEIFQDVIYSRLNNLQPKFRHKIVAIKGDIGFPDLGMSIEDRKMLASKVNVIFHVAATVKFDEKIQLAVNINARGTKEMLLLAKECTNLQSFVHVSTAYSNCTRHYIEEKLYPSPVKSDYILSSVETLSEQELNTLTPCLLGDWPNTYAFTKAVAEDIVNTHKGNLPICIFRPAIVVSTYREPIRGWIDNFYGPTGVIAGAAIGVLRTLHCDGCNVAEMVPADMVVNGMLAASYKNHIEKSQELPIYNYVSSVENPISWYDFTYYTQLHGSQVPTIRSIWYYSFTLNKFKIIHLLYALLLHYLPALIVDSFHKLIGKEPQLMNIYTKINRFTAIISYFSSGKWTFTNNNVQDLWNGLTDADQRVFPFSVKDIDWSDHCQMNVLGIRTYIVKDDPSTIPEAKKKLKRLRILHYIVKALFFFALFKIAYAILSFIFL